jgi:RHS repeat-associated protein
LGTADNGNVTGITNNRYTTRSQSFTGVYPERSRGNALNRVATAVTTSTYATSPVHCWGEAFSYDAWGNLQGIGGASSAYTGCTQESLSVSATTKNQLSGYGYDAAGNMTSVPSVASYTYNAEGEMTSAAGVTYTYDGDGKRVQKSNGKLYWYGMGSSALDESDASGNITNEYVFFAGKRVARRDSAGNVSYYFADHLGTARVVTNSSGAILDDSDFYPFGGERPIVSSSGNTYKFTGKERDSESGLDDFGARYYSSALGRFVSSDWSAIPVAVPYAVLTNPQTLNLNTYVKNNPLHFTDPTGHGYAMFDTRNSSSGGDLPMGTELEGPTTEAQDEERLTIEVVTVTIGGAAADPQRQSQQQVSAPVSVSFSFAIGEGQNITMNVTAYSYSGASGWNGASINATLSGCDSCRYVQTVGGTDIQGAKVDQFTEAKGKTPVIPAANIAPTGSPNQFNDTPRNTSTGDYSRRFVTTVGLPGEKSFKAYFSFTWGYDSKHGHATLVPPRQATSGEMRGSLAVVRTEYPGWRITNTP